MNQIHTVMGWVQNKRDMGGVIFIDLRDREGILQVVFDGRNLTPAAFAAAEALKLESVIAVEGPLRIRGEETYNPKLVTGEETGGAVGGGGPALLHERGGKCPGGAAASVPLFRLEKT